MATNELQTKLNEILENKNTNLKPENLKKGVSLLGVDGSLENNIKLFSSISELKAFNLAEHPEIEYGIIYSLVKSDTLLQNNSYTNTVWFPKTVTLSTAITSDNEAKIIYNKNEDSIWNWVITLTPTSYKIHREPQGYSAETIVEYTSEDGINYTRTTDIIDDVYNFDAYNLWAISDTGDTTKGFMYVAGQTCDLLYKNINNVFTKVDLGLSGSPYDVTNGRTVIGKNGLMRGTMRAFSAGEGGWASVGNLELASNGHDLCLTSSITTTGKYESKSIVKTNFSFARTASVIGLTADKIKKGETILGITGTAEAGTDTSDATATAADILFGKTAYVNGVKITGTITDYEKIDYSNNNYELVGNELHIKNPKLLHGWSNVDEIPVIELQDATILALKKHKDEAIICIHSYDLNMSHSYNQRNMSIDVCIPSDTGEPVLSMKKWDNSDIKTSGASTITDYDFDIYAYAKNENGLYDYSTNGNCKLQYYKANYKYQDGKYVINGNLTIQTDGYRQLGDNRYDRNCIVLATPDMDSVSIDFTVYNKLFDFNNRDTNIDGVDVHYIEIGPTITIAKQLENMDTLDITLNVPGDITAGEDTNITNKDGVIEINEADQTIVDTKYKSSFIKYFITPDTSHENMKIENYILISDIARCLDGKSINIDIEGDESYNYNANKNIYATITYQQDGESKTLSPIGQNLNSYMLYYTGKIEQYYSSNYDKLENFNGTDIKMAINVDYNISYNNYMY